MRGIDRMYWGMVYVCLVAIGIMFLYAAWFVFNIDPEEVRLKDVVSIGKSLLAVSFLLIGGKAFFRLLDLYFDNKDK